jgi:Phage tail tube protein, TTP
MPVTISNGSIVEIAATYGTSAAITAISNASAPIVTAANTLSAGDYIEMTSGWSALNNGIFKVGASPTATTFTLIGIDTSNILEYVPGVGVGSFRKIATRTVLDDITDFDAKGGDWQKGKYQPLAADREIEYRTVRNPYSASFNIGHPIPSATLNLLSTAETDNLQRAFIITMKQGGVLAFSATVAMDGLPTLKVNERMVRGVNLWLTCKPTVV